MLHLVFDGAWADADLFWWPLGGWELRRTPLPEAERGWWNVPLEVGRRWSLVWRAGRRRAARLLHGAARVDERCGTLATVLILVRHGRTALNAAGLLQGRVDEPLDEIGRRQAVAVAERVGAVDELVSSPLLRARQTAEAFGVPFTIDERWIELAYGIYEGVPHADVPSEAWRQWRRGPVVRARGRRVAGRARRPRARRVRRARRRGPATARSPWSPTSRRSSAPSPGRSAPGSRSPGDRTCRTHRSAASTSAQAGPVLLSFNEAAVPSSTP